MHDPIQTIQYKGYTINIDYDPSPENPREWSNLGILYSNSRRYDFDGHGIEELIREVGGNIYDSVIPWDLIGKKYYFLKVWMYDHSGVRIKAGGENPWGSGWSAWDSGLLGVVAVSKEDAKKEYGYKRVCKSLEEKVLKVLSAEIDTLDAYASGQVYGYEVLDENGDEYDSCWGFYDLDYCESEAKSMVDYNYEIQEKIVKAEA